MNQALDNSNLQDRPPPPGRANNLFFSLWALPVSALLIVAATLSWFGYKDYGDTLTSEFRLLTAHTRIAEAQMAGRLLNLNTLLAEIALEQGNLSPAQRSGYDELLHERRLRYPELRSLVVTNAEGRVIFSATPNLKGFDSSKRDYFIAHLGSPLQPNFYVSRPFKTSFGDTGVAASVAFYDREGKLKGTVVSGVDPEYFTSVLRTVRPEEEDGIAALINADGFLLNRLPSGENYIGRNVSQNQVLQTLTGSKLKLVHGIAQSTSDNAKRLYSVAKIGETGLVVLVGREMDTVLVSWRNRIAQRIFIFLFSVLVVVTLTRVAHRREHERRLAESLIRREKQFSSDTIASLPGVFYLLDEKANFVRWNARFETISGYSAAEMAGKSALDLIAEVDRPLVSARILEVFESGESYAEAGLLNRNGLSIPHYFTGRRVELEGKPYLIGFGIDISERQQLESRAMEMAALNGKILFASPVGISAYKAHNGECVMANEAAARLVGTTPEVLMSQSYLNLRSWRESGLLEAAHRTLAGDLVVQHETRITSSFGKDVWLDVRLSKVMLAGEAHLLVVYEEVGERRRVEEAQAYSLLEASPESILVSSSDSDGASDVEDADGEAFGSFRLEQFITEMLKFDMTPADLLPRLSAFNGNQVFEDDIGLIEIAL